MYTTDVYQMYTKYIQNLYHIFTNVGIHFLYKIKRTMPAKFCIQNVCKMYTKFCRNVGYILYANILYTFRIP